MTSFSVILWRDRHMKSRPSIDWHCGHRLRSIHYIWLSAFYFIFIINLITHSCTSKSFRLCHLIALTMLCTVQIPWQTGTEVVALYKFTGYKSEDLPFRRGDILTIVHSSAVSVMCHYQSFAFLLVSRVQWLFKIEQEIWANAHEMRESP